MTSEHLYNSLEIAFTKQFKGVPGLLHDVLTTTKKVILEQSGYPVLSLKYEDPKELFNSLCSCLNVNVQKIVSKNRHQENVAIRQFYCYAAKQIFENKYTLDQIGNVIGGKDHTTVIHCIQTCKKLLESNDLTMLVIQKKWELFNQVKAA